MPAPRDRLGAALALVVCAVWCSAAASLRGDDAGAVAVPPRRVPWTTSRITGTPEPPLPYTHEPAFAGLAFDHPTAVAALPGSDRLVVAEEKGRIFSFRAPSPGAAEAPRPEPFLDLTKVAGLDHVFDIAFHPRFTENRTCYVVYALEPKRPEGTRVSRFTVDRTTPAEM